MEKALSNIKRAQPMIKKAFFIAKKTRPDTFWNSKAWAAWLPMWLRVCCSMLQQHYGAIKMQNWWQGSCSVLQCVADRCGVLHCVWATRLQIWLRVCWSMSHIPKNLDLSNQIAQFCSVLQCVAVCCSVLQCVAVCCSVQYRVLNCAIFKTQVTAKDLHWVAVYYSMV